MEAHLEKNDKKLFYSYLDKATNYFEYGSGGSTYQASIKDNIKKIYTVESDIEWINKLKKILNKDVNFIYVDMKTKPNNWGYPGENSTKEDWIKYSNVICEINYKVDLILIDGRFRVACCLKCFDNIDNNCYIVFDDFLNRPQYHIVLDYYNIIDKTVDNRMVILRKKNCESPSIELIKKYEYVKN